MPQDIVREFMRDDDGDLRVAISLEIFLADLHDRAIGARIQSAAEQNLEP